MEYTPLLREDGYLGYILGDNGLCRIYSGESLYLSFTVTGNVIPAEITPQKIAYQSPSVDQNLNNGVNEMEVMGNCINYPRKQSVFKN